MSDPKDPVRDGGSRTDVAPAPLSENPKAHSTAASDAPGLGEPAKLDSPLKPLLWLLIPLILVLVYGVLFPH